jgi:hypothetical protein
MVGNYYEAKFSSNFFGHDKPEDGWGNDDRDV